MAKNSDKNRVLERRRVELLHAIEHQLCPEAVLKRVTALKQAVIGVAKKQHVTHSPFRRIEDNPEWQTVNACWTAFTTDEVVAIVQRWSDRPSYKDVFLACRDVQTRTSLPPDQDNGG